MTGQVQKVAWKRGFHNAKVDAEKAFDACEKVRERNGGELNAADIVDAAKAKRSPLHKLFEWDDSEAATQYRLEQARRMLRSFEVHYVEAPALKTRAYEVVTAKKSDDSGRPRKVYRSASEIMEDPIARDELLGAAIREAISYRKRYAGLSELAGVFHALDSLVENYNSL